MAIKNKFVYKLIFALLSINTIKLIACDIFEFASPKSHKLILLRAKQLLIQFGLIIRVSFVLMKNILTFDSKKILPTNLQKYSLSVIVCFKNIWPIIFFIYDLNDYQK